jgi:hypothetical protein
MLPLVEKAAEHLTAIDEAWDGQINFALFHCIGPSIQTALFNAPLVVLVGWVMGKDMDLNFEIFMIVLLVLAIVVVGNFLRDGESNYLEGAMLIVSFVPDTTVHTYSEYRTLLLTCQSRLFTSSLLWLLGTTPTPMLLRRMARSSQGFGIDMEWNHEACDDWYEGLTAACRGFYLYWWHSGLAEMWCVVDTLGPFGNLQHGIDEEKKKK